MTLQQCLTCTRRNIPPSEVRCPACGGVDLRGYDPEHGETDEEWVERVLNDPVTYAGEAAGMLIEALEARKRRKEGE